MKKRLYILSALLGMVTAAEAQTAVDMRKQDIVDGVSIENLRMERNGAYIAIAVSYTHLTLPTIA